MTEQDNRRRMLEGVPTHLSGDQQNAIKAQLAEGYHQQPGKQSKLDHAKAVQMERASLLNSLDVLGALSNVRQFWESGEIYAYRERFKLKLKSDNDDNTYSEVQREEEVTKDLKNGYIGLSLVASYPGVEERIIGLGKKQRLPQYVVRQYPSYSSGETHNLVSYKDSYEKYETSVVHGHRFSILTVMCEVNTNTPFISYSNGVFSVFSAVNTELIFSGSSRWQTSEPIIRSDQLRTILNEYCALQQNEGITPKQLAQRELVHGAKMHRGGFWGRLLP